MKICERTFVSSLEGETTKAFGILWWTVSNQTVCRQEKIQIQKQVNCAL